MRPRRSPTRRDSRCCRSTTSGPSTRIRQGRSSCSRCRTATTRRGSSSPACANHRIRPVPWRDWIRTIEIEPSIYGADFARLGEQLEALLRAECRVFHFDIGDGHFVEPITMGPIVLKSISPLIHRYGGVIDVHMMVDEPAKHLAAVAEAGGDSVTVHIEAVPGGRA